MIPLSGGHCINVSKMFGSCKIAVTQKPLVDASFPSVYIIAYVYKPGMADVRKPNRVHMGHARPKINYAAIVY